MTLWSGTMTLGRTSLGDAAIIIPVRNAIPEFTQLIASLVSADVDMVKLIVIDDASCDPDAIRLSLSASKDTDTLILRNNAPVGFSAAVNAGVEVAREAGFQRMVVLNSDTQVTRGAIEAMLSQIGGPKMTAVCGALSNRAGWQTIGSRPSGPGQVFLRRSPVCRFSVDQLALIHSSLKSRIPSYAVVPYAHGFAFAVDGDAFTRVGGFNASAFRSGHGAELDLGLRLRACGYRSIVCRDSLVLHAGGRSTPNGQRRREMVRSRRQLYRIHGFRTILAAQAELRRQMKAYILADENEGLL